MSISSSCHHRQWKSMGRRGGSYPTQGNSWWTKTPAGAENSNKWLSAFLFANFTRLQNRGKSNFGDSMASQVELRNDHNLQSEDVSGLRAQYFHTLISCLLALHISTPFNKQIQPWIKHVAVSKSSGFSVHYSHYSAVKVKGSDAWCENYILSRCHVCLKFLLITIARAFGGDTSALISIL